MRQSSELPPSPLLSRPLGVQSRPPPVRSDCTATPQLFQLPFTEEELTHENVL